MNFATGSPKGLEEETILQATANQAMAEAGAKRGTKINPDTAELSIRCSINPPSHPPDVT